MTDCCSFKPSIDEHSRVLILGSMPGVRSLSERQYYAHPQNRFWRVMSAVCSVPDLQGSAYDRKLKVLLENGIALWDVIEFCSREGSLDSDILNEKPNDLPALLKSYPRVKTILFNGSKAFSTFMKYFPQLNEACACFKMPSTSPANARYSLNMLTDEWKEAFERSL